MGEGVVIEARAGVSANDQELAQRAVTGDRQAFDQLVARYQARLTSFCRRFFPIGDDAEDAAQESFVRAWQRVSSFRGDSSFATWLYRVATRVCLNILERRGIVPGDRVGIDLDAAVEEAAPGPPLDQQVAEQDLVRAVMAGLCETDRVILWLRYDGFHSYAEIARQLAVPEATVRSRVHRHIKPRVQLVLQEGG